MSESVISVLPARRPFLVAVENGFFKEVGIAIELVKCHWKTYKDALALGSYDFTQHLVMYFLTRAEQGPDGKFLAAAYRLSASAGAGRQSDQVGHQSEG